MPQPHPTTPGGEFPEMLWEPRSWSAHIHLSKSDAEK